MATVCGSRNGNLSLERSLKDLAKTTWLCYNMVRTRFLDLQSQGFLYSILRTALIIGRKVYLSYLLVNVGCLFIGMVRPTDPE
jgi:hypothetical protein